MNGWMADSKLSDAVMRVRRPAGKVRLNIGVLDKDSESIIVQLLTGALSIPAQRSKDLEIESTKHLASASTFSAVSSNAIAHLHPVLYLS
jgi:hypothetical protein